MLEADVRYRKNVYHALTMITQFGINMLVPIFLCSFIGIYIDRKCGTSFWMVLLFFVGYFVTMAVTANVVVQYVTAGIGFAAGILLAVFYDRRLRTQGGLSFQIVRLF